jgi:hypothetical protein
MCREAITQVYLSPQVDALIKSVRPEHLQDDLRQEMALALLSIDCKKISEIWASNGLIGYAIKIITNMAFSSTSPFYKKFRKKEYDNAIQYLRSLVILPELDIKLAHIADNRLKQKYQEDELQAHESILFTKYVELRSCKKVADFYNIPEKHVKDVIKKTKKELKQLCISQF